MKNRLVYIDAIRGLAILLMVMGHAIAWSYEDWNVICMFNQSQPSNIMAGGFVWQVIYSFHMALFFMVSGYLSGESVITKDNMLKNLKSKSLRLFLPYLVTGYILYAMSHTWEGYWFLLSLYEMSLLWIMINPILNKINKNRLFVADLIFLSVIYILLRLLTFSLATMSIGNANLGIFIKYYLPFCLGVLMKRHLFIEKLIKKRCCFSFCLLLYVVLFSTRYLTTYPIIYKVVEKVDFFTSLLALLACSMMFHIFMNGINKKLESFFAYLGRLSMPIYILHNRFVLQFSFVGGFILQQKVWTSITFQLVNSLVLSAIAIFLCILVYKFISHSRLFCFLLFGEKF